jgi:hypothetical protein
MTSSYRMLIVSTILILLIIQINGGYWVCDWVNGRGWMYCSGSLCTTYLGRKRSISINDDPTGPTQNNVGIYCLGSKFCYTCEPINDDVCIITRQVQVFPMPRSYLYDKRSDEDICS